MNFSDDYNVNQCRLYGFCLFENQPQINSGTLWETSNAEPECMNINPPLNDLPSSMFTLNAKLFKHTACFSELILDSAQWMCIYMMYFSWLDLHKFF